MDAKEAQTHLQGIRSWRKEIATPLRDPKSTLEDKKSTIQDLQELRSLLRNDDPNYRQSLRILAELRTNKEQEKPEFPTTLEGRINAVMSGIGNHSGKSVALLCLDEMGGVQSEGDIEQRFREASGHVWKAKTLPILQWFTKSIAPIGIVAEEATIKAGSDRYSVGFSLTDEGKKYGVPVAKFVTKMASNLNVPLIELFGGANSVSSNRAPYTRFRILELLASRKDELVTRDTDIMEQLDLPKLPTHLIDLEKCGLLVYDSTSADSKDKFKYALNAAKPREGIWANKQTETNLIFQAIKAQSEKDKGEEYFGSNTLHAKYVELGGSWDKKIFDITLGKMSRKGYLKHGEFSTRTRSNVSITTEGVFFVKDFFEPLKTALSDSPEGDALRKEWDKISWREYASEAVQAHLRRRGIVNKMSFEESTAQILKQIRENPGIRTTELQKIIYGKRVSIAKNMRLLLENGDVENEKNGAISKWFPAN